MANYFISSFFLAITNPITIIGFTGFFASFGVITNNTSFSKILILLLGIALGSSAWWFGIAATVNKFKNRITLRNLVTINRIAGILLVLFGVGLLVSMFVFNKGFK
jgi:threonine/homoserine/homoserine lactone efflux protein